MKLAHSFAGLVVIALTCQPSSSIAAPDSNPMLPISPASALTSVALFPYRCETSSLVYSDLLTLRDGTKRLGHVMEWADQVVVYDQAGRAGAYPVEEVQQVQFRRFQRHRIAPALPDLTVAYVERLPRDPSWQGHVVVEEGVARLDLDPSKTAWHPEEGSTVTFNVHVLNAGGADSPAGPCRILVDGEEMAAPALPSVKAGQEHIVTASWKWMSGAHTLRVELLPGDQKPEIVHWNNVFEEPIQAQSVAVVVAADRYDAFKNSANIGDSFCFEDWIQYQFRVINALFAASVYPTSPGGIVERVRCDRIIVVDDPEDPEQKSEWEPALHRGGTADGLAEYAARMIFGKVREDEDIVYDALKVDWPGLKELGLQLGLIDLTKFDTRPDQCLAADLHGRYVERRHLFSWPRTMMYAAGGFRFTESEAAFLNQVRGQPRGSQGDYLLQIPAQIVVEVRSITGHPLPDVLVDAYQLQSDGELAGYIAGAGAAEPLYSAPTGENGRLTLLNQDTPTWKSPLGYEGHPSPFGKIAPDGSNGLLLLKLHDGESEEYHFLQLYDCNLAYLHGATKEYVVDIRTRFGDRGSLVPPSSAAVIVEDRSTPKPPAVIAWSSPPNVDLRLVDEFRVYERTSFAGDDQRPWNLVSTVRRGPFRWNLQYEGQYFNEPAADAGFSRDSFYAVSTVDALGRESGLSAPGYLAFGKEAIAFAIDRDAGYATLAGDGPVQMLRWDGKVATQPFGVRAVRFPGYRPGFGGVAISADHRIVVADPRNHVLAFYDEQGNLDSIVPARETWPGFASDEPGEFNVPFDVAVDPSGQYYVADYGNNRVQILDSTGRFKGLLDEEFHFEGPQALGYANGHLCVTDSARGRCRVYDLRESAPKFVCELPPLIDADRGLVSRSGKIYITARATSDAPNGILVYTHSLDRAVFDHVIFDVEMGKVFAPRGFYLYINALDEDYGYCVNQFPFDVRRCRID